MINCDELAQLDGYQDLRDMLIRWNYPRNGAAPIARRLGVCAQVIQARAIAMGYRRRSRGGPNNPWGRWGRDGRSITDRLRDMGDRAKAISRKALAEKLKCHPVSLTKPIRRLRQRGEW